MEKYKNLSGNSGVSSFEIGDDFIIVEFSDSTYLYNYLRPGSHHVEKMKKLARYGQGLSTYISVNIRKNYYKKLG